MDRGKARISVIGLGFVGLSLATVNARTGFDTIGVDVDSKKIDNLKVCRPDFFDPDMNVMLRDSMRRKKIHFTADLDYALQNSEITFLAVGTPLKKDNSDEVDLSHVKDAAERICLSLKARRRSTCW